MENEDSAIVYSDDSDSSFDAIWLRPDSSESAERGKKSAYRRINRLRICNHPKMNVARACNRINESDEIVPEGPGGSCVGSCTRCCSNNVVMSSMEPEPVAVSYRRQDCIYQLYWYMQDFKVHFQESCRYCLLVYEESQLLNNFRINLEQFLSSLIKNFPIKEDVTTHYDIFTFKLLEPIESALEFLREFKSFSDSDLIDSVPPTDVNVDSQVYHQLATYCHASVKCIDEKAAIDTPDEEPVKPVDSSLDFALDYFVGTATPTTADDAGYEIADEQKSDMNEQSTNSGMIVLSFQDSPPTDDAHIVKKKLPRRSLPRRPVIEKIKDITTSFCKSQCDVMWHNVLDCGMDGIVFERPRKVRLCIKVRDRIDARPMFPKLAWKDPASGSTINYVNMLQISHIVRGTQKMYRNIDNIAQSNSFTIQMGNGKSFIFQVMNQDGRDEVVTGLSHWIGKLVCRTIIGSSAPEQ